MKDTVSYYKIYQNLAPGINMCVSIHEYEFVASLQQHLHLKPCNLIFLLLVQTWQPNQQQCILTADSEVAYIMLSCVTQVPSLTCLAGAVHL